MFEAIRAPVFTTENSGNRRASHFLILPNMTRRSGCPAPFRVPARGLLRGRANGQGRECEEVSSENDRDSLAQRDQGKVWHPYLADR
jgi:hypothetical protein